MKDRYWLRILTLSILLLCASAYAGERRNIKVYDGGQKTADGRTIYEHYTLLDTGECNELGCVTREGQTEGGWPRQYIDEDGNGTCDVIVTWKPLVDPSWGTYYYLDHKQRPCDNVI
jgi:hypothetical protein